MKKTQITLAIAAAFAAIGSTGAYAVSFTQNDVTLDISGTVNGFYVNRDMELTNRANGQTVKTTDSQLTNGLLPGWINFVATAKAGDQDVKAHISFAPGIADQSTIVGLPSSKSNVDALGLPGLNNNPFSQIDTRNVYFQFGNNNWGTLKFGRDIGLFARDIILADMTLLGVGGTSWAGIPFNTSFGMIGHGYLYTGFQPQITYTTPDAGGLQASVGIFQPSKFAGDQTKTPGLQAIASYDWKGDVNGKLWGGLIRQTTSCSSIAPCTGVDPLRGVPFTADGQEIGVKAGAGNFEAVLYGFNAKGLGLSTVGALFLGGGNAAGERTKSSGYFAQGTYKLGATKIGLNYGQNTDKDGVVQNAAAGREIKNKSYTLGVYHSLNKFVTLVAEYNQEKIDNVLDLNADAKNRSVSLGGILFF